MATEENAAQIAVTVIQEKIRKQRLRLTKEAAQELVQELIAVLFDKRGGSSEIEMDTTT